MFNSSLRKTRKRPRDLTKLENKRLFRLVFGQAGVASPFTGNEPYRLWECQVNS